MRIKGAGAVANVGFVARKLGAALVRLVMLAVMLAAMTASAQDTQPDAPQQSTTQQSTTQQPTTQQPVSSTTASLVDKIQQITELAGQIETDLAQADTLMEQATVLESLPIDAATIESRIQQLTSDTVTLQQMAQTNEINDKVDNFCQALQQHNQTLTQAKTRYYQANDMLVSVNQLLDNPLNKNQLSVESLALHQRLIEQLPNTLTALETQLGAFQSQFARCQHASDVLTRWQQALSAALSRQQSPSGNDLNKRRYHETQAQYSAQAAALLEKLRQQNQSMTLTEIADLQGEIYQQSLLATLSEMDSQIADILTQEALMLSHRGNLSAQSLEQMSARLNEVNSAISALENLQKTLVQHAQQYSARSEIVGEDELISAALALRKRTIDYQLLQLTASAEALGQQVANKKQQSLLVQTDFYHPQTLRAAWQQVPSSLALIAFQVKISVQNLFKKMTENIAKTALLLLGLLVCLLIWIKLSQRLVWGASKTTLAKLTNIQSPNAQSTNAQSTNAQTANVQPQRGMIYLRDLHLIGVSLLIMGLVYGVRLLSPSSGIIYSLMMALIVVVAINALRRVEQRLSMVSRVQCRLRTAMLSLLLIIAVLLVLAKLSLAERWTVMLFERLFLLLLLVSMLIFKPSLHVYLRQLKTTLSERRYQLYRWLILGLPWLVIATCVVGLLGFGLLAWAVLIHMVAILGSLLLLLVGLAGINRLRKKMKLLSIKQFTYGAFIAQDIVSPIATLMKLVWFASVVWGLFAVMQWQADSLLINRMLTILNYPLVNLGDSPVTPLKILLLMLSFYVVVRVAKWFKTFSYHWLFIRIKDLGVRQSLAIFGQYFMVLVGLLIVLNTLGIDLTSLVVFAGALGVGIGLGLQDIAKNFISGIIILLERPMRTGDWVGVGTHEGIIKSIGMRAITMQTFDKQEVIIPNGDVISNSFTNWTHSDSITRTVLYVGASYRHSPDEVMALLNHVIDTNESILADPVPEVVMWEYADSAITYRLQYFIDLDKSPLWGTKTAVLREIWHQFKAHNIEIPYPQRDIHFRNLLAHKVLDEGGDK
ncbi:mechanosensitive ion channel family protein [Ostreibacterium oceani]|uniref:Mechanosensitive ion channel n=1 Tax=Ostreibacterium oceani TaxID=2654998 RepID=A0A6N7F2U7_9GAMM|nr:mechanosensitive ion channel domain-containing protein [Ostreibacterium oceani]MPV86186.1 mechanosensitive ion channel [Ostreibacterium oceani]